MLYYIKFLFIFLLAGCPQVENPPPPKEEPVNPINGTEREESFNPFDDFQSLLQKPLEPLPEGMPKFSDYIEVSNLTANLVTAKSLLGIWYGAVFKPTSNVPNKEIRVYLQLRDDQTFSFGSLENSSWSYSFEIDGQFSGAHLQAKLVSGKYLLQDGNLLLHVDSHPEDDLDRGYEGRNLNFFVISLNGDDTWRDKSELVIPVRHDDLNTMVLFTKELAEAKVFLVRR